jgi:AcrR family transcriptional regulator
MSQTAGRRSANKQATRAALHEAAERLFARQGYEATTVAQIAAAAGVGERTFYRYFGTKEDLPADRDLAWIGRVRDAIRSRPATENSYQAVAGAMTAMAGDLARGEPGQQAWVSRAQPLAALRGAGQRPARRLEQAIAEGLLARGQPAPAAGGPPPGPPEAEFEAQLIARVAVAALRSAVLWQRGPAGTDGPGFERLLAGAFTRLSHLAAGG